MEAKIKKIVDGDGQALDYGFMVKGIVSYADSHPDIPVASVKICIPKPDYQNINGRQRPILIIPVDMLAQVIGMLQRAAERAKTMLAEETK